jgi:6-phospho-beta-glucosidase
MKLAIIGGGSVRTPRLIPALARRAQRLGLTQLVLMDTDTEKLDLIGGLCRTLAERSGALFSLDFTTDARDAISGAHHVITSIRPGKERGRAIDERIAFSLGVLGQETTGAGGYAMAMRSIPAILGYARLVEEAGAPGAWLYNFTNPAGLVAQALTEAGIKRVVGICDSANGAQSAVSSYLGIPRHRLRHTVYGLNHLSWTSSVRVDPEPDGSGGEEVLPSLLSDEAFIRSTHMMMFAPGLREWQKTFLNEYLHYFYHRDEALAALLKKPETRGEETLRLTSLMLDRLREIADPGQALAAYSEIMEQRSSTYMAHARPGQERPRLHTLDEEEEGYAAVALGCIEAIANDMPHYTGLNVPNNGVISGMRDDDVVEVLCRVDASGITPLPVGEVPEHQYLLMRQVKLYERVGARAILDRSRTTAYQALALHPLVGSYPLAVKLIDAFLAAHRELFDEWN